MSIELVFDEVAYLSLNPDVAAAVKGGAFSSGRDHFERHGRSEGRACRETGVQSARKTYGFNMDVFSHCNLRCPTCIVGNKFGEFRPSPKGLMASEFLGRILDKALSECDIKWVALYNWAEPLLHPNLPELVRQVKSRKLACALSSNLNILHNPEELLAENPDYLRVSLSGFTQKVYEVGHRPGDIEKVKRNMERLADAKSKTGATSCIEVFYHRYIYNAEEIAPMEAFARSLGFEFRKFLAQIFPVEKIINISEGRTTAEDRDILAKLALPLGRALEVTARQHKTSCELLDEQVTLDIQGNVMLCAGSSMERSNVVGNFLDFSLEELQSRRRQKTLCQSCLKLGIPDYLLATPAAFEDIAADTIACNLPSFQSDEIAESDQEQRSRHVAARRIVRGGDIVVASGMPPVEC